MSKIKKIMALLMTVAMVMGMSMTTLAADSATITVENLEDGTTIKSVQVIKPNPQKETGWAFADNDMLAAFQSVYEGLDEQTIIWKLIKNANPAETAKPGIIAASAEEIKNAIDAIEESRYSANNVQDNVVTVNEAGVYAIKAEAKTGSATIYAPMAGYVSFQYHENGAVAGINDTVVYAKKSSIPMEKNAEDEDGATQIGEIVTYTVNTAIPHYVHEWKLTDTISGAEYVVNEEGKVEVSVKVGNGNETIMEATVNEGGNSFTLDLLSLITPTNLGAEVTLSYQAKVIGTEVSNEIEDGQHNTSETVKLYTGKITLTKFNENETQKLEGAEFEVRKDDSKSEALHFTAVKDGVAGAYKYDPEGTITNVATGSDGTLVIEGLNVGTYYFKETKAPDGYHPKEDPKGYDAEATLTVDKETGATGIFDAETSLTNTKLSALPATGGIGTTIFTIGGCVIMIAAAGLFFANRRKDNK